MSAVQIVPVGADDAEMRLDRWFHRRYPQLNQGQIQKMLREGQIRVNGKRCEANTRVIPGQQIRVPPLPDAPPSRIPRPVSERDAIELKRMILFQDDWVIAINKPAGLAVQGGTKIDKHLDAMLDSLATPDGERPRLVHRLDRDTSGVLLLARTRLAAQRLTKNFADRRARKYYWAVTIGVPTPHQGRIDAALAKLPGDHGERMRIDKDQGAAAATMYQVVDHAVKAAWVALWPLTGRTHQLRAHMELIGTPILGDAKYAERRTEIELPNLGDRLHLHARRLIIAHPGTKSMIDVTAPLPKDMADTFKYFGFGKNDGDPFEGQSPK